MVDGYADDCAEGSKFDFIVDETVGDLLIPSLREYFESSNTIIPENKLFYGWFNCNRILRGFIDRCDLKLYIKAGSTSIEICILSCTNSLFDEFIPKLYQRKLKILFKDFTDTFINTNLKDVDNARPFFKGILFTDNKYDQMTHAYDMDEQMKELFKSGLIEFLEIGYVNNGNS